MASHLANLVSPFVEGLLKACVETPAFVGYVAPTPEPQLKVRVLRGVIKGEPKVSRDPETDKVISAEVVEWVVSTRGRHLDVGNRVNDQAAGGVQR